jgi:hypothetical protein
LFMHFLGASRDGLVARRVDLDTISSSDSNHYGISTTYYQIKHSYINPSVGGNTPVWKLQIS